MSQDADADLTVSPTPAPRVAEPVLHELRVVFSVADFEPPAVSLGKAAITVGRVPPDPAHDAIQLDDRRVSRVHLVVAPDGGGEWVARDQASHNGVWIDGARVDAARLAPGSVVRVGSSLLLLMERAIGVGEDVGRGELHGPSAAMRRARAEARLAAAQTYPVLLTGETGVGKERLAREIHRLSGRAGPFVALNCAAISAAVAESELFGHAAGAFTGALRRHEGVFDAAQGGTLLLDEIGEMPLELQPKLLRALALGEVRPVGASDAHAVDVRVLAATNRDLDADVRRASFRADLLARLGGWRIEIAPLRARREDILPLAKLALTGSSRDGLALSADAAEALLLHDWPFNVRELEQIVAAAALRATSLDARTIAGAHLPPALAARVVGRGGNASDGEGANVAPSAGAVADPDAAPRAAELEEVLARCAYNVSAVARHYGKERRQIYRWLERHGIDLARRPGPR